MNIYLLLLTSFVGNSFASLIRKSLLNNRGSTLLKSSTKRNLSDNLKPFVKKEFNCKDGLKVAALASLILAAKQVHELAKTLEDQFTVDHEITSKPSSIEVKEDEVIDASKSIEPSKSSEPSKTAETPENQKPVESPTTEDVLNLMLTNALAVNSESSSAAEIAGLLLFVIGATTLLNYMDYSSDNDRQQ